MAIVLFALVLRLPGLGRLGFWIDEDLTWLAVDGILADGTPRLPSGAMYLRSVPYSYFVAGCAWLFGVSHEAVAAGVFGPGEIAYRLPSLLCSLITLIVMYATVREVAGPKTALVSAFVLASSPWDAQYAHMARMYSLLELLTATATLIAVRSAKKQTPALWISNVVVIGLATVVHRLGAALAIIPLLPLLIPQAKRTDLRYGLSGIVGVAIGFAGEQIWWYFPALADHSGLEILIRPGTRSPSLEIPFLPTITLNYARVVWYDLLQVSVAAGAVVLGLLAVIFAFTLRWIVKQRVSAGAIVASVCFLAALLVNQLVIAIGAAFVATKLAAPRSLPRWCAVLGACAGATVAAAFVGQALGNGPASIFHRPFLRVFFAMPVPFYRMLAMQFPVMFAVVCLGSIWITVRSLAPGALQGRFLLVGIFWATILAMGLFESPYVVHRYLLHLNPVFVAIFTITIAKFAFGIARRLQAHGLPPLFSHPMTFRRAWTIATIVALIVLFAGEQSNPWDAWKTIHRPYGRADLRDADSGSRFWFDFDGCGEFLTKNAAPEDIVMVKDAVHYYPYGVRADYHLSMNPGIWAADSTGRQLDWYLAIPFVQSLDEFDALLSRARTEGQRCWIAYTRERPEGPTVHLPDDLLERLDSLSHRVVHTGRDGHTVVMRIDPTD